MKKLLRSVLFLGVIFSSCSVQKRHYTKGLYLESFTTGTKSTEHSTYSAQEKLKQNLTAEKTQTFSVPLNEEVAVANKTKEKKINALSKRKNYISVFPAKISTDTIRHEPPDPSLNRVAKAGFRMSIFSLVFLSAAIYLLQLDISFYLVLGVFIVALVFALVSLFTSLAAGKDRITTNRKGLRFSRFGIILSLLIFAGIIAFFIFTPFSG
jgi:hypothetical protein